MVTVKTKIVTEESARRLRVEKTGNITQTNVQKALETLDTGLATTNATVAALNIGARPQRSITGAGDLPIRSTDAILLINVAAPLAITVPAAAARTGAPLSFIDVGRTAATNNITLNRTGADTFDALTAIVMATNGQEVTLIPANDGVNAGYVIG